MVIALLALLTLVSCEQKVSRAKTDEPVVKNVVFLIGDGMGLAQVSKAMQLRDEPLNLEKANYIGLIKTTTAKEVITDSAASATSFAIGFKTVNGAIGVDANGNSKKTILETLAADGYATGLIATSGITHATPASYYAHVSARQNYYAIAEQLVDAPVTLFIGGSEDHFDNRRNQKNGKPDDRNLVQEMQSRGVTLIKDLSALKNASGRVGYFTADEQPKSIQDGRSNYLPQSIKPSIEFLQKQSDKGFFMMVEGSQIDWGGHANDLDYTMSELYEFDQAVGAAMKFADEDGDTLVLITAHGIFAKIICAPSILAKPVNGEAISCLTASDEINNTRANSRPNKLGHPIFNHFARTHTARHKSAERDSGINVTPRYRPNTVSHSHNRQAKSGGNTCMPHLCASQHSCTAPKYN